MAIRSHVVARFGFHPTFCHFDTYTRTAEFNLKRLEYLPVKGAEALQWGPGRAAERRDPGTLTKSLPDVNLWKIRPDRPVPAQEKPAKKIQGVLPDHWIYVFATQRGEKRASWYAELFALDEITTALNPKATRAERLDWAPSDANKHESPPANVSYSLNGRDNFVTAIAVPYRLSDECLDALEAEMVPLTDFVEVSSKLQSFPGADGLQWLEIPVLHPWNVAENLATEIRAARSRYSRRNGMPGENPSGFGKPPIQPEQAETESCKQYALMSAIVALMNGNADLRSDIEDRLGDEEAIAVAKRSLKTRPYEQLRYHVEAELLGADLAGWLSRRLVRILMDGYIVSPAPTKSTELEDMMTSLALATVALKYTSTGLEFLRRLRTSDWRDTLLGSIADPSAPSSLKRIEDARPYVDATLAIGAVALTARVLLDGTASFALVTELETLFETTFQGDWKNSLDERKKIIKKFVFWDYALGETSGKSEKVRVRARRLELKMDTTSKLEKIAGAADKVLKVLDAINLALAIRELREISESNPKLRREKALDIVFQSLDFVKTVLEFAVKGEKGLLRLAPRVLGTIVAARTAWKSLVTAREALTYGDINAFAAMAVTSVTSILAIGVAAIGEAGAAAAHVGAVIAAIGVLASLLYTWAKDTELETFVAHSSIGDRAFFPMSTAEPGWATVPLKKLAGTWDRQLKALAALQGQFTLFTDSTMHHQGADMNNVRLRPGIIGSASRFIATWQWKAVGDAPHAPLHEHEVRIEGAEGMLRDSEGVYIDLTIPPEIFNKATDAGKPIPPRIQLSVVREIYASDGVKVTLPLHGPAVMDCRRIKKPSSEKIRSMDIVKAKTP